MEGGRLRDREGKRLKSALREVARAGGVEFRLTPSQNLILANIDDARRVAVDAVLAGHGVPVERQGSALRRASMACVSLPTCGMALAEGERMFPGLLDRVEGILGELGLEDEEIGIRLTGCPNGCVRPYVAEIGIVGRAPGVYQLWLGGDASGTRLNRVYIEKVKEAELDGVLRDLFRRFAGERLGLERFGEWSARRVWPELEASGAAVGEGR